MWQYENRARESGKIAIAGVDEAGRGPLAGPVVSGAVILPIDFSCPGLTDSKKVSPKNRDRFYGYIMENALGAALGVASVEEIEHLNILQASLLSMKRAVSQLPLLPDHLLIDGKFTIDHPASQQAIVKGDSKSISIAAASILAKVGRDRMMQTLHERYPEYGFDRHKGYPTKAHKSLIENLGPSPVHRKTFRGVKEFCQITD